MSDLPRNADYVGHLLKLIEEWCKGRPVYGCGNYNCSRGCKGEYEDVPDPHVRQEFSLWFDYDEKHGGWGWEVEGVGLISRGDDPLALLERIAHNASSGSP